jgi:TonB family protein
MMLVQIDEDGKLMSAKVASGKGMYGFNDAAMQVTNRMRFSPGYKSGQRVKMVHYLPIKFVLDR